MKETENLDRLREVAELEAADEKLRKEISSAIIENLPDAIVVGDQDGTIFQINREAELIFGYPRKELLGQKVEILMPEEYRDNHPKHREGFTDNPRTRPMGTGQLFGRRRDGKKFPAEISLSPIPTERGLFVIVVIRRSRKSE